MKESFIFYLSFYEALKELPDDIRLKLYDMITIYALKDEEVDCDGIEKAVFSLVKPQIKANKQRYLNGCKGGAKKVTNPVKKRTKKTVAKQPNENQERTETEPNENQERTETEPNENQERTEREPNENVNVNVNVIPPLYSPPRGQKTDEDLFFERYPRYAKDKSKARVDIDYKRLLEEFDRSSYCRNLYTMKQINENYCLIISGEFRDKPSNETDIDQIAARARYYSEKRTVAENRVERVKADLMKHLDYFTLNGKLGEVDRAIAKSEIADDDVMLSRLIAEKEDLIEMREALLKKYKYKASDLEPSYECHKCRDTGWQEDGRACDCYKLAKWG